MQKITALLNRATHVVRPGSVVHRRSLIALLLTVALLSLPSPGVLSQTATDLGTCAPNVGLLGVSDALDGAVHANQDVGGLSALDYDLTNGTYYSLVDRQESTPARFFTLSIGVTSGGLDDPEVIGMTELIDDAGLPFTGETLDGEGITQLRDGSLLVASETEPSIRQFSPDGQMIGTLPVPERFLVEPFGQAGENRSFESLSLGPGGVNLYTANEAPLSADGWTDDGRGRIRLLRYRMHWTSQLQLAGEYFYVTEPGQSVVDLVTIQADRLLVMERGVEPQTGTTVRVFHIQLDFANDVSGIDSLKSDTAIPARKTLLVDLADCLSWQPSFGSGTHPSIVANYEGITLGPLLDDGRQALILQSDDNFDPRPKTRILALSVDGIAPD